MKKIYIWILPAILCIGTFSCKNTFDIVPEDVLTRQQVYQNLADADNSIYGVYGKFLGLVDRYIVLNELRADLVDVTFNTNNALKEINLHNVSEGNNYADPKPFYEVIMACNNVLKNLDQMFAEGKINQVQRNERYSDIGALRSWVYLQLGIHYGSIPYVTEPIENISDLNNEALHKRISFDELLEKLTQFTASLPNLSQYAAGSSIITSDPTNNARLQVDGVDLQRIFIYRRLILGDLHLWNNNYLEAAKVYKAILDIPNTGNSADERTEWRVSYNIYDWDEWGDMFEDAHNSSDYNDEWVWSIPLLPNFEPGNPLIDLFSYSNGKYQLKPSALAINNWAKENKSGDGAPGDWRGAGASWENQSGQPVVKKFIGTFDPTKPLEKKGIWYLNRAGNLHLRFAEAANRDGMHRLAWSMVNHDLKKVFDPLQGSLFYSENFPGRSFSTDWPAPDANERRDMANIQKTPWLFPYNFNAQEHNRPTQIRGPFSNHVGVRGRAGVEIVRVDSAKYYDMSPSINRFSSVETLLSERPIINQNALTNDFEDMILNEAALELAFEGHRWGDLVRIARRRNDPSILAKRVAAKFTAAGDFSTAAAIEQKLMEPLNWYLPFKIK
ncbi:RagB/SusD family nutrient uptake outer membrane protein [Pedobacter sp. P351]|uniref:RagB/SusD family nutrient uptake outer membrane protein n=1 Tax=Pedobacter superstes TaxID=3133441 RepID=UPI0030B17110